MTPLKILMSNLIEDILMPRDALIDQLNGFNTYHKC